MPDDHDLAVFASKLRDIEEQYGRPGLADQLETYFGNLRRRLEKHGVSISPEYDADEECFELRCETAAGDYCRLMLDVKMLQSADFDAERSIDAAETEVTHSLGLSSGPSRPGFGGMQDLFAREQKAQIEFRARRRRLERVMIVRELLTCVLLAVASVAIVRVVWF